MTYNRIYARIDVDNLRYNIEKMKSLVKPDMKLLIVIKADAYGHGACEIAKRTADMADYYGVATIDEAIELRQHGIDTPILIIGYTDSRDFDKVLEYNITQTVYDASECSKLSSLAMARGCKAKVHIKVDTGMARIGFMTDEAGVENAIKIKDMPGIEVEGIFTHYAKADEADKEYAHIQKKRFAAFVSRLEAAGMSFKIKHIDNSAGVMELRDNEFDMIRLGIVTYGLYPSNEVDRSISIRPVMSLIAHVAHVKLLPAGVGIGYGLTYTTSRETRVATVTVGYADGYPRALSNTGRVLIHGRSCPILGRVCMDQIMVDVSELEDVRVTDPVVLIGADGDEYISVEEVAEPAASFNYELVCNISRRVPRVYCQSGMEDVCINYLW